MNGVQIHLALNHLPVFAIPTALIFVFYSLIRNSSALGFSLRILFLTLLSTIVPYVTGEPAEDIAEKLDGVSKTVIHAHEEAGETSLWIALAAAAVVFLAMKAKKAGVKKILVQLGVALAMFTMGSLVYTSKLGGLIRHPEINIP